MSDLDVFFNPKSIAVIGASRTPGKIGYTILENLKISFSGKILPINPNATEIHGLTCFPSVLELEEPIDLAVIAVKAELVKETLEECIKKKIKGAIIISSGFSEIGNKKEEEEIKKLAKGKIRIIGPNCIGTYTNKMNMSFFPREKMKYPLSGQIAFITQSGAVGAIALDMMTNTGVGISKFASIGNKMDVNEIDLLNYLDKDMETRCIAMYIESIANGNEFIKTAKRIVKNKPIIVLKAGKTEKGSQAILSHTGALTGTSEVYSTAFKQAGVIEVSTIDELFDFSKILASQPFLKDKKICIVTDGGGFGVLAADQIIKQGMELPELSKETEKKLKPVLPAYAIVKNPLDLTGDANSERFDIALEAVLKEPNISGVLCIALMQIPTLDENITNVLRDKKIHGKPIIACAGGSDYTLKHARALEKVGIPVYPTPERAANAFAALWKYGQIAGQKS